MKNAPKKSRKASAAASRPPAPADSTRNRILRGALALLESSGIKGVTQPAVAKLVGIPQGQLTYHFKHRADLVLAVTDSAMDGIVEYFWKHHPAIASKSFTKLIGLVLENIKSKTRVRALLGLIVEADENPVVLGKLLDQGAKVRSVIATILQLPETTAEVTLAHALMLGFGIQFFMQNDRAKRQELEKHFQVAVQILEKHLLGLKKKPTKTRGR